MSRSAREGRAGLGGGSRPGAAFRAARGGYRPLGRARKMGALQLHWGSVLVGICGAVIVLGLCGGRGAAAQEPACKEILQQVVDLLKTAEFIEELALVNLQAGAASETRRSLRDAALGIERASEQLGVAARAHCITRKTQAVIEGALTKALTIDRELSRSEFEKFPASYYVHLFALADDDKKYALAALMALDMDLR